MSALTRVPPFCVFVTDPHSTRLAEDCSSNQMFTFLLLHSLSFIVGALLFLSPLQNSSISFFDPLPSTNPFCWRHERAFHYVLYLAVAQRPPPARSLSTNENHLTGAPYLVLMREHAASPLSPYPLPLYSYPSPMRSVVRIDVVARRL